MSNAVRGLANVALRTERAANARMRKLLSDLDKATRVLGDRAKLDKTAKNQVDRVLRDQQRAWSDLAVILNEQREDARKAANRAATEAERELLDLLPIDAATRRRLIAGPDFSRSKNAEVARRISDSARTARQLLVRNFNGNKSGKELATTVKKQISPRTKGGISYVAQRLTRTEIAVAFHEAQIERAAASPWVKGLTWKVSPGHVPADVCDLYNNKTFPVDEVPKIPHPNCACTLEPVLMSKEEFQAALEAGLFDAIIGRRNRIVSAAKALRRS